MQPLWKKMKRTINAPCFRVRLGARGESRVPFGRGKTWLGGILHLADLGSFVTGSASNKHVTVVHSSSTTYHLRHAEQKSPACVFGQEEEELKPVVYINKWQNFLGNHGYYVTRKTQITQKCFLKTKKCLLPVART